MADTNNIKNVLSVVATSSDRVKDLTIQSGQLVFIQDKGRIAFDFKGKRVFYNQLTILDTEEQRLTEDNPLSGYYFVIDTAVLWFYQDEWVQITGRPQEVIFVGVELPELGQANKLYIRKDDKEISIWDEETNQYIKVANFTDDATNEDIENLFKSKE